MKAPSVKPVRCAIYTRVSTARPLHRARCADAPINAKPATAGLPGARRRYRAVQDRGRHASLDSLIDVEDMPIVPRHRRQPA